jgi:SMC interacting uncharacterized protein involved in chromosome segregation
LGQQFPDESVAKEIFTANGERLRRARKNADVVRVNLRQDVEPSGVEISVILWPKRRKISSGISSF